jgi:hypothetical protein
LFDSKASRRPKSGAYTPVREHFSAARDAPLKLKIDAESGFAWNAAIGQKMGVMKPVCVLLKVDAFGRTRLHRLFNAILRPTLGQDDLGLFLFLVKGKNFRTKLDTAFAANAFIGVNDNNFSHGMISFYI